MGVILPEDRCIIHRVTVYPLLAGSKDISIHTHTLQEAETCVCVIVSSCHLVRLE